jgi:hypothetical protein
LFKLHSPSKQADPIRNFFSFATDDGLPENEEFPLLFFVMLFGTK